MFCQKLYATLMSKAARLGFRDKTPSAGSLGTVLPQTDRCRSYPVKHEQMTQKKIKQIGFFVLGVHRRVRTTKKPLQTY